MAETLRGVDRDRLERSCSAREDWIRLGAGAPGLERAEVRFATCRFSPHRHDTYAIGITTAGVQAFRYRGSRHICLPGQLHFLYPDETHDGGPATDAGFAYRIVYIEPSSCAGRSATAHSRSSPIRCRTALLRRASSSGSSTRWTARSATSPRTRRPPPSPPRWSLSEAAVRRRGRSTSRSRARARLPRRPCLRPDPGVHAGADRGIDRYAIARQFRRAYGTSPDRYRTMRRLGLARAAIQSGVPLARAAVEAGFADQSHMTRQFVRAYGLTPGRWARAFAGRRPLGRVIFTE